jgi:hypothetical protein
MNDQPKGPRPDIIGPDDLIKCMAGDGTHAELTATTLDLLNKLRLFIAPIRESEPCYYDGALITALVLCAGGIMGELSAMGIAPEMTPEATAAMLSMNWYSGLTMGTQHVLTCAAAQGVDPVTGRPPVQEQG